MKNKLFKNLFFYLKKPHILFLCFIMSYSCNSSKGLHEKRPNIILLLADDLGYNELGSYGQKIIRTPNLDSLAKEGMIFKNFYAGNAACAPSRAVLHPNPRFIKNIRFTVVK